MRDDRIQFNVFHELEKSGSLINSLFKTKNSKELLNIGRQAPSPSKDYYQLLMTCEQIIVRKWQICSKSDANSRYPIEMKDNYEDFLHDDNIQREISRIFGKQTLVYIKRIVENGHFDILSRMPETILVKILSFLHLEDIAKLSQVSKTFRELCRSDRVWKELYKTYYTNKISDDLYKLADRDGWRRVFFTNKIKLQLELRRSARTQESQRVPKDATKSMTRIHHHF